MLTKEEVLDAVYVATPASTHLAIVKELVASTRIQGMFVEKPLAGNAEDALKIVELTSGGRLKGMMGFQKRFSPLFRKGKMVIDSEILGNLTAFSAYSYVSGVFSRGQGWRLRPGSGGALLDLGPHLIDMLIWYFGEVSCAQGNLGSIYSTEVDDLARGSLKFECGLAGSFDISWSKDGYRLPEMGIEVHGSNGRLIVTDDCVKLRLLSKVSDFEAGEYLFMKPELDTGVKFQLGDPEYCMEDEYFMDCLRGNGSPEPDFESGLKVNRVIERISGDAPR